ncbi:uncharacterized protein [Diadema antillarum]|uniref:uncharacterized protein n=1 Tax=Diadema antillarum TaxID=105358 RepID=UPI003A89DE4C
MLLNFLRLAWLFNAVFASFANPYGNIGCHFSAVCRENEECVDDNLFGSCINSESVTLPYYDVSANGFRDLKIVIKLLLNRGYQWKDEAAQKTLATILEPYQMEYVNPQVEALEKEVERERQLEALEEMARQYRTLFPGPRGHALIQASREPEQTRVYYDDQNQAARGDRGQNAEQLIEEYVQAIENSANNAEMEEEEKVNWLYQEYYQKYLDLLEQYRVMEEAAKNGLLSVDLPGGANQEDYARVMEKLDYLKQYLEELDREQAAAEEAAAVQEAMEEGEEVAMATENGEEGEEGMGGMASAVMAAAAAGEGEMIGVSQSESSSWSEVGSISEAGLEEILGEEIDHLAVQLITNELIPQMSPAEQAQWRLLNEEEKEAIIEEALDAIDWVAMEMDDQQGIREELAEEEDAGQGQVDVAKEMMMEPQVEEEEEEEEEGKEAAMADGGDEMILDNREEAVAAMEPEDTEENGESPLFQPDEEEEEEENGGENALQLDVLPPPAKKDESEDDTGDVVSMPTDKSGDAPGRSEDTDKDDSSDHASSGYIFITFNETIPEEETDLIVDEIARLLQLPASIFSVVSVKGKEITIRVNASSEGLTLTDIATKIGK